MCAMPVITLILLADMNQMWKIAYIIPHKAGESERDKTNFNNSLNIYLTAPASVIT